MSAKRMSAREARANVGDLLGLVHDTKEPVIVERRGRPYAVVISPEDYERLEREREAAWQIVAEVQARNADKDPDEVLADVTAEVEAVRRETYAEGEQRRTARAGSVTALTAGMLKGPEPRLSSREEKIAAEEAIAEEVEKGRSMA